MTDASTAAFIRAVANGIEVAAIVVLLAGFALTAALGLRAFRGGDAQVAYRTVREWLGRAILLTLELLVAADIIGTVAIEPTIQSLIVLGGIVLIRTFLSFSLEVEIEGRWPWRRRSQLRSAGVR